MDPWIRAPRAEAELPGSREAFDDLVRRYKTTRPHAGHDEAVRTVSH